MLSGQLQIVVRNEKLNFVYSNVLLGITYDCRRTRIFLRTRAIRHSQPSGRKEKMQ